MFAEDRLKLHFRTHSLSIRHGCKNYGRKKVETAPRVTDNNFLEGCKNILQAASCFVQLSDPSELKVPKTGNNFYRLKLLNSFSENINRKKHKNI